jgi:hypothetical protein
VVIAVPVEIGDEALDVGTTVLIPREVPLAGGAIPPGTPLRTPSATVLVLPASVRIAAVEGSAVARGPLNATLQRTGTIGTATYPAGTSLILPSGTVVQGSVDPQATAVLGAGTTVQIDGQMAAVAGPVAIQIAATPVAQPASLPRTGDAVRYWGRLVV